MFGGFSGQQGGVHAAQDDRHAALAKGGADLVGAPGGEGFDADGDQVGRLVVGDRFQAVIVQRELHIRRGQRGQHAQRQRLHARLVHEQAVFQAANIGTDEGDLHGSGGAAPCACCSFFSIWVRSRPWRASSAAGRASRRW